MKRVTRLTGIALFVAACASAEFSDAEKAQVKAQISSLNDAMESTLWALRHAGAVPSAADEVATYIEAVAPQWRGHTLFMLDLLDMERGLGPREEVVQSALVNLADDDYAFPQRKINQIPGSSSFLDSAKSLLQSAIDSRAPIDTTLSYAEPRMAFNLAQDGVTREQSPAIFPHGDYRAIGKSADRWSRNHRDELLAVAAAARACPAWIPGSKPSGQFMLGHITRVARHKPVIVALATNIHADFTISHNGLTVEENIEALASTMTQRPTEFANLELFLEMMLMETHTGSQPFDVSGRHTARGLAYDLNVILGQWSAGIANASAWCAPEDEPVFVGAMADGIVATGTIWAAMDDMAFHGGILRKYFEFPAAPGGGGDCPDCQTVCGIGTTDDGTGNCVADIQTCGIGTQLVGTECQDLPPLTCGEGTSLIGDDCIADILECPTRVPVLDVLSDRILARCVVQ